MGGLGKLWVVPTPIGNLGDITLRALEVLRSADLIFAEDTRRTRALLTHFDIPSQRRLRSMPAAREGERVEELLEALALGRQVALTSDAGMPGVSDPGSMLVRTALDAGYGIEVLPGASAVPVAVVASGLPGETFTFYGFPPRKQTERHALIHGAMDRYERAVFFESPHRVGLLLEAVAAHDPDRPVALGRELTKKFETWLRGTAAEVSLDLQTSPPRGEYVVVVAGADPALTATKQVGTEEILDALAAAPTHLRPRERAKEVARNLGIPSTEVYAVLVGERSPDSSAEQ